MKALVTIEVPDDGKCKRCRYVVGDVFVPRSVCNALGLYLRKDGRALKKCRDAVQRYREGVR